MQQSQLFQNTSKQAPHVETKSLSVKEKTVQAVNRLKQLLKDGYVFTVATSFGKDSSVCLAIALMAVKELINEGFKPPTLHVMNSNTQVENPVIDIYAENEIRSLEAYSKTNNLPVVMWKATPNLSNNYLVNIIGGRIIFTFPDTDRKCQQMMKANPLAKTKRLILKSVAEEHGSPMPQEKVLTLIGTRFDESGARARNMLARGESAVQPVLVSKGGQANWTLSPIADFTTWDVFEFIGEVRSGRLDTYSDFENLLQVYRDSEGGECMINIYASGRSNERSACGARTGCWTCCAVSKDKSMENMLNDDEERYNWMQGLNNIRNWVQAKHYDWSSRNWLARTVDIEKGTIKISPNAYSPEFCLDLLRYVLTVDVREEEAAQAAGLDAPRFKCLKLTDLLAVDCLWNRYGYQKGLQACATFHDIYVKGKRYDIPTNITHTPSQPMPREQCVPFIDEFYWAPYSGLRDLGMAVIGQEAVVDKHGMLYSEVNTDEEFTVDEEGAELFFGFELEYALDKYHHTDNLINPTAALEYLLRLGVVSIYKGSHSEWDRMLRVANQIWRHGIRDYLSNPVALVDRLTKGQQQYSNSQGTLF